MVDHVRNIYRDCQYSANCLLYRNIRLCHQLGYGMAGLRSRQHSYREYLQSCNVKYRKFKLSHMFSGNLNKMYKSVLIFH